MLLAPLNYSDMLQGVLVSRGVDPRKGLAVNRLSQRDVPPTPVKVHGAASSPELVQMGRTWAEANQKSNWAKSSGVSRASIDWWTDSEK